LRSAKVYGSVADAVADLDRVYAATARTRFMNKAFVTSRQLPADLRRLVASSCAAAAAAAAPADFVTSTPPPGNGDPDPSPSPRLTASSPPPAAVVRAPRAGLLFGRENSGLTNEEVAMANKVLTIEADPAYPVLNLAQAVVCTAYELFQARLEMADAAAAAAAAVVHTPVAMAGGAAAVPKHADDPLHHAAAAALPAGTPAVAAAAAATLAAVAPAVPSSADELRRRAAAAAAELATRGDVEGLLGRLVAALEGRGFFESAEKRPATLLSIRNLAAKLEGLS
ncbi:putative tRNA/rRNA methyltransferase MJ1476, partial [Tetrabaena socialis]